MGKQKDKEGGRRRKDAHCWCRDADGNKQFAHACCWVTHETFEPIKFKI